jgi:hypothetical protein
MHQPFAAIATILTGFHFASQRHSFTSVAFSPPAAYNLARRPPTSAAFTLRLLIAHSYLISQSIAKVHLHSSAAFVSASRREIYSGGFLWSQHRSSHLAKLLFISPISGATLLLAPSWGLAGNSVRSSLHCLRAARRYATVPTSVRHSYASFLPQALLPAGSTHLLTLLRKQYPAKNTFSQCIFSTYPSSNKLA